MIRKVYCSFSLDLKLVSYSGFPIYVSFFTKNAVRIYFKILKIALYSGGMYSPIKYLCFLSRFVQL